MTFCIKGNKSNILKMKVETQKVVKSKKPYTKKLKEPISVFSKLPFELKDMILQQVPHFYEMIYCGDHYMYDAITKKVFQFKFNYAYKFISKELDKSEMIFNTNFMVIETPKKFKLYNIDNSLVKMFMIKRLSVYTELNPRLPWNATEFCKKRHIEECLIWDKMVKQLKINKATV
jgi:hypothetical protein